MHKIVKIYLLRHAKPNILANTVPTKDCGIIAPSSRTISKLIEILPNNSSVIHSPLERASKTFSLLTRFGFSSNSFEVNSSFAEQNLGLLEGLSYEDAWKSLETLEEHNWAFFHAEYVPPDGESFVQLVQRVTQSLQRILETSDSRPIIIIAHSGVIRSIVGYALDLDPNIMLSLRLDHLSLSCIEYKKENKLGGQYQICFLNRSF